MKTRAIQFLFAAVLAHFCLNASAFTLWFEASGDCPVSSLIIDGDISAGSSALLAKAFIEADKKNSPIKDCHLKQIYLDSKCVDVEEAMAMGRMIRAKELDTSGERSLARKQCYQNRTPNMATVIKTVMEPHMQLKNVFVMALHQGI